MAKDLAYLRAQVRTYLDESSQADWTDAEVDREINDAYHRLATAVYDTWEDYYLKTVELNTVANQQDYTSLDGLPTDLIKIRRVEINYSPSTTTMRVVANPVEMDEIPVDMNNSLVGSSNPGWMLRGNGSGANGQTLSFLPYPTENGTNAIKIWYIYQIQDLVESTDPVLIPYPDRYAQSISRYASGVLLSKGQQEERVGLVYLDVFKEDMRLMTQQLEDRKAQSAKSVIDVTGIEGIMSEGYGY